MVGKAQTEIGGTTTTGGGVAVEVDPKYALDSHLLKGFVRAGYPVEIDPKYALDSHLLKGYVRANESLYRTDSGYLKNNMRNLLFVNSETVSRTIYVATTGSDITGDGLVGNPFATILKALQSIKTDVAGYTISIQCGSGTFAYTLECDKTRCRFRNSIIELIGTFTDVLTNLSFTATSDPFVYNVTIGGFPTTWTTDQYRTYFLESSIVANFRPISGNTAATLEVAEPVLASLGTKISQSTTIINITPGVYYDWLKLTKVTLSFSGDVDIIKNDNIINTNNAQCLFTAGGTTRTVTYQNFIVGLTLANNYYDNIRSTFYDGAFNVQKCVGYMASNNVLFDFKDKGTGGFIHCIMRGNSIGYGLSVSDGGNNFNSTVTQGSTFYLKFTGLTYAFSYQPANSAFFPQTFTFILSNVSYFTRLTNLNYRYCKNSFVFLGTITGAPSVRWFYDNTYFTKFYNPPISNIVINGILYPEQEYNLSAALTNNTTTNVIVGNKLQNKTITIDYTITRGTGYRKGKFDIINDGTNTYMSPDEFITNGVAGVSNTAIVLSVNYNTNEIRVAALLDNGIAGTFTYNVSRVMITPLTL